MKTELLAAIQRIRACYQHVVSVQTPFLEEQLYWDEGQPPYSALVQNPVTFMESGDALTTHPVSPQRMFAADSEFRFFLDGAQHTRLLLIADGIPVCLTVSSVTILERVQPAAALQLYRRETQTAILLPEAPLARPLWQAFESVGLLPQNIINPQRLKTLGLSPDEVATQFELCRFLAYDHARRLRENFERRLVHAWVNTQPTHWLVVDGDLRHLGREIIAQQVLGVVKRQRHQYFNGVAQAKLLNLAAYHRTNLFQFTQASAKNEPVPRTSFFLRWRERRVYHDPLYGLIRVEAPRELDARLANTLSQWLIAENPPSENARNGNHLYPIARAEQLAKRTLHLPLIHF